MESARDIKEMGFMQQQTNLTLPEFCSQNTKEKGVLSVR